MLEGYVDRREHEGEQARYVRGGKRRGDRQTIGEDATELYLNEIIAKAGRPIVRREARLEDSLDQDAQAG